MKPNVTNEGEAAELVATSVRGSNRVHYLVAGHQLTLCARIAEYRWRYMPKSDYCHRCVSEAIRRGWMARP